MSANLTVVTQISVIKVRRRAPEPLRLSPLLRHALATAQPRADGQPLLLPTSIPHKCCHDLFRCRAKVQWRVGDGRNKVFFCQDCFDRFWEAGYDVTEFSVERWKT